MKIALKEITVKELTEGYKDNSEAGVVGFGGELDEKQKGRGKGEWIGMVRTSLRPHFILYPFAFIL